MGGAVVSRLIVLIGGTLYPAYESYKAVKSANVRQYVRWMMYWVIFALFITVETFTDILLSWLPFYYEIKVGFLIWLLSPYTKGAAFLYRKFVHPTLSRREPEIDRFLTSARERSYATMVDVGTRGINVAANAVVTAAVKGQAVVSDRLKSFSVNDLSRLSDETPIHSMNPTNYNPPMQREHLHRSPLDPQRFERSSQHPQSQSAMQTEIQYRHSAEQASAMNNEPYQMIHAPTAPSSGLYPSAPSSDGYMVTASGDHGGHIGGQFKAYSMMNLSQARGDQGHTLMTRTIEFTSAPPETSVDDSMLPDHHEYNVSGDDRPYDTLPRQRRKKSSKKDKESTSVRRSKRHSKAQSYHEGSLDERDRE
ncbi:uncharacterized protein LOC120327842 isoform X1 [Styela clava]